MTDAENPLDLTIPIQEVMPLLDDPRTQAIETLGEVLCSTRHSDVYLTKAGPTICAEDLNIAAQVVDSDWLAKITAHREQLAAAQVIDQAKANLLNAKPTSAPVEPYLKVQEALAKSADHLRPLVSGKPTKSSSTSKP